MSSRDIPPSTESAADLAVTLARVSPRFTRPQIGARNVAIYGAVFFTWVVVTLGAWFAHGLWAWAAGLVYVVYDTWLLVHVAYKTRFLFDGKEVPKEDGVPPPVSPSIGVLIAAYNEAPALPATIGALLPQLKPGDAVLIVDDGSEDHTVAMLRERYGVQWSRRLGLGISKRSGLLALSVRHGGKARALNAGIAQMPTDVIVTVDADTQLAPDAIAALRLAFAADAAMVGACCVIRPVCPPGAVSRLFQWFQTYEYIRAFCSRIAWMRADALLLVSGAFAGFRRDALVAVGGFDPDCLVEDYELIHRLHRYSADHGLGWRVSVLPGPRAVTDAPASLPSFLRQRRRWFAGFLQTQYWNRDMTFNGRYGSVGRWMLPIKALDTMQPIFGLTAFVLLIAFALGGRLTILVPVLCVILGKIVIDVGFYMWWVRVYARWTQMPASRSSFGLALLAALAEPFSFQLLRHLGAAWGWCAFLTRRHRWGVTASMATFEVNAE